MALDSAEIRAPLRPQNHLNGDSDVSEEEDDPDEAGAAQLIESTRNILGGLDQTNMNDETILPAAEVCQYNSNEYAHAQVTRIIAEKV